MCKTTKVKSRRLHSQNRIILIVLTIGETPSGAGYSLYRIFCIMNPDRFQLHRCNLSVSDVND